MSIFLDTIAGYMGRGWALLPYSTKTKRPVVENWQKKIFAKSDFTEGCNVGMKLTEELCDVDLDCPEALELADVFLPPTGMQHGRKTAPRGHRWYKLTGKPKYKKFNTQDKTLLELRVSSKTAIHQTMIPPSVHPSGEALTWEGETPSTVEFTFLKEKCGELAAACLLVRHFPENNRNNLALALSGVLLRKGWDVARAENFLRHVFTLGGSLQPELRVRAVQATQAKLEINEPFTGIPKLVEILGEKIVNHLVEWLGLMREESHHLVTTELMLCEHVARNNTDIFYRSNEDAWYTWDGKRWTSKKTNEINRRVLRSREIVEEEAAKILKSLPTEVKGVKKGEEEGLDRDQVVLARLAGQSFAFAKQAAKVRTINAVVQGCQTLMANDEVVLDADPWLFNLQNGTLDLQTPELRPHSKEDYITKISPVVYDGNAKCPKWEAFLEKFLPQVELREFMQGLMGYAMTGSTKEQIFPIFWGQGNNGKSTLVETIAHVWGDYARTASDRAFIETGSETQPGLVALEGARFVRCSEPKRGDINESLIKQMTGDDEMEARGLYENLRTIRPTWKAMMLCNNEPHVKGGDDGIWRRLRLVPFNVKLQKDEIIKDYAAQLLEEAPGVLNWCLMGCVNWQLEGLPTPQIVLDTTEDYRNESDPLDQFMMDCIEAHPGFNDVRERCVDVYQTYAAWSQQQGQRRTLDKIDFSSRMRQKGFERIKTMGNVYWVGLKRTKAAKTLMTFSAFVKEE